MMYTNDYLTDRIQTYNKLNMQKEETELYSFAEASKMISAEEIKKYLCRYQWSNEKFVDDNDREITAKDIALLKSKLNLEKLSAQIAPNYAICVQNTNLRLFPTKQGCYKEKKKAIDYFAVSLVKIGERVICWHKDKSGKWCFIQTKNAWGWVYTHTLALMDEENWLKINEQEFIQVLTPRIKPDNCNALFLYATRLPFVGIYAQKYAAMLPKRNKW